MCAVHRLLTVCVGTLLAADAGLIGAARSPRTTSTSRSLAALAPQAQVCANRVFVVDGPVWSSAGVTAGIDRALHCISDVCGDAVAAAVAETMVVFQRRAPTTRSARRCWTAATTGIRPCTGCRTPCANTRAASGTCPRSPRSPT